jgi:hypothetical protein
LLVIGELVAVLPLELSVVALEGFEMGELGGVDGRGG